MINHSWSTLGGSNKNVNRDSLIQGWHQHQGWLKESPWKIQYNALNLETEAEEIRTKLANYTGFSKIVFPKEIGLPRKNQLKVWYGGILLWDYGQEQTFPEAWELIERTNIKERYKWNK